MSEYRDLALLAPKCSRSATGTEKHHTTQDSGGAAQKWRVEIRTHLFPCSVFPQPPSRTEAATLAEARAALPRARQEPLCLISRFTFHRISAQSLFPKGRIPSLTRSEYQRSNTDGAQPLSKQLLSDSVRPKQAPGVTEFSHLPEEINKRAVLPCEDGPPASRAAQSAHSGTAPRENVLGSGTKHFLKPNAALCCPGDPPSGRSSHGGLGCCPGQPPLNGGFTLSRYYDTSPHPSFHTCKMGRTLTSHNTANKIKRYG